MTEGEAKASGAQLAKDGAPQQDVVKTGVTDQKMDPQQPEEVAPSLPAKDNTPEIKSDTPSELTESSPKGKAKEEPATKSGTAIDQQPRDDDSLSIGPSDRPAAAAAAALSDTAPVCAITLLLPTGARHPYRLDEKYLAKRNVDVPETTESGKKDPFSISVYKLKELILREWREEWEGKPASPSSIRLIHFGKLLDDKEQLRSMFNHFFP